MVVHLHDEDAVAANIPDLPTSAQDSATSSHAKLWIAPCSVPLGKPPARAAFRTT
jgi:hypothetical protein